MMNPYAMLAALALLVSSTVGAFFFGRDTGKDSVRADHAKELSAANEKRAAAERRMGALSGLWQARANARDTLTREIYREIPRIVRADPVYANVCVSDDGVRLVDRAHAAAVGVDPGAPAGGAGGPAQGAAEGGPKDGKAND